MSTKRLQRTPTTISIASFHEQNQANKYNFSPPYQRHSVWSDEKQSYFIDSILRNFPIPPIFLHRKIDPETGRTSFDVIDGKQRLTAIARFINNEIPSANEYGAADEPSALDGAYFFDLSSDEKLFEFRNSFWKYDLPVEYIDPTDVSLIEDVFDRLNRNGERLNGQELRNAQFHSSNLLKAVEKLRNHDYFRERLEVTDLARMEDKEFTSECLLTTVIGEVIGSNQKILDSLYERFKDHDFDDYLELSEGICTDLATLNIDYQGLRIGGVSHLYGLWSLAFVFRLSGSNIVHFSKRLSDFFIRLRSRQKDDVCEDYRKSMNSRTKERFMRIKRLNALLAACDRPDLARS